MKRDESATARELFSSQFTAGLPVALWIFAIQAFFVGMLVVPTAFQLQRGAVLVALTAGATVLALRQWRVHFNILLLWLATMLVGAFGIAWGLINDAPGALRVSTVYLVWPALYMLFIGLAHNLTVIRQLESALLLGIAIATTMGLAVLVAGLLGLGDIVFLLLSFQDAGFGAYQGYVEFRIYNLTTVMYGFPFLVSLLLARRRELGRKKKILLWLLVALMVVIALGSGRRMFWLIALLTPFVALFFIQISALRLRTVAMIGILIRLGTIAGIMALVLIVAFELQPSVLVHKFVMAFSGQEASSSARYEQAEALWRVFESSPLIGIGLGSKVDVIRSVEQPWAYELWYLSLLKSVGLFGLLVYITAVGFIVVKGMALARRDREFSGLFIPQITALFCFLVMTGTNPYLAKFDYLWVIFLPVALINTYLIRRAEHA